MNSVVAPKALLCDWDNTLIDSWHAIHEAWCRTLAEFHRPAISFAEVQGFVRMSARESFPKFFGADADYAIERYCAHYRVLHAEPQALSGAFPLLQFCVQQRIPCGVISNKNDDFLHNEIATLGWQDFFELGAIGAGRAIADKPSPEVLHYLLHNSSIAKDWQRWWYIGDTGVDLEFAYNCGMVSVLIGNNLHVHDHRPDRTFPDLKAMLEYLKAAQ